MARNENAVLIASPWADDEPGNRSPVPDELRRAGWGPEYSASGGRAGPERLVFNQLLHEMSAFLADWNTHGAFLPWSSGIDYRHDDETASFVMGSDGRVYVSNAPSGPATGNATDPVLGGPWSVY